jgi:outer membrane receptor protein involved in Fe transport
MERIEVLRGPQGTVFGANSQGGTVIYITTQPILGEWEAYAQGDISNTASATGNNWNWQAVANIPIMDNFAVRILAYDGSDAGYIDNNRCRATNPAEDPRDPDTELSCLDLPGQNWVDTSGLRINALWQLSDSATIKGQFWWQSRDTGGDFRYHPFQAYEANPTDPVYDGHRDNVAAFTYFDEGKFVNGDYSQTPKPDDQKIYSLTGLFDLSFADLTTTISHYNRDFDYKFDSTWIITFLLRNNINNPPCEHPEIPGADPAGCLRADLLYALTDQKQSLDQNAAEIRFNSKESDSPFKWVVGGFWRERKSDFQSFVPVIDTNGLVFNSPNPPQQPPTSAIGAGIPGCNPCVFARIDSKEIKEWAVFGELSYSITDTLDVNVGARYFTVDQTEVGSTLFQFAAFAPNPPDPNNLPSGATPPSTNKLSDNKTPWKIALDWQVSDELSLYALRANGFRLGGTNNRGIGAILIPEEFESDELINYEIGEKAQFADGRYTLNASLFHMKWENLQVAGQDLTGAFGFIGNAGSAVVNGLEVEFAGAVTEDFMLTGQVTYLGKKELTEDQISDDIVAPGKKGDQLPRVPEWTTGFTAQYNYQMPIAGWMGGLRFEGSYQGSSHTQLRPTSNNDRFQDSYALFNARASFHSTDLDLDIIVYIDNIFDKQGDVFIDTANGQPTFKITNQPQTVGIQVTKGFGR